MSQGNLTGRKVLVVEEDLQAKTIADALADYGAKVVGPFRASKKSLSYCVRGLIDAAVLDIKEGDAGSFTVADRLVLEEIPFIFLIGSDWKIIPRRFQRVPRYLKSFVETDAPAALAVEMLRRGAKPHPSTSNVIRNQYPRRGSPSPGMAVSVPAFETGSRGTCCAGDRAMAARDGEQMERTRCMRVPLNSREDANVG
ncbi:hypothetical protein [Rhizobium tubonense]|uniref:Response regulatory domain-containing protein n=1 Tax=Rhizobium tubonense TaxID=484088 RepID=A0A2W4DDJ7_9HYPH|nr:hypothetical protein [Rhizobium tubonense]PZM14844.1 hypothetical protein CPY51_09075 [Rhizobium tubonense]